ncbi:MAG: peptide deformylase [bacterium]
MKEIKIYPDTVLRQKAARVEEITKEMLNIAHEMIDIMYTYDGIGLAAPQIGISKQIIVVDYGEGPMIMFNPKIIEMTREQDITEEGCLSLPDITVPVLRPVRIQVKFINEENKNTELNADNIAAKVFQHEVDHLNGILIIDHISSLKKSIISTKLKKLEKKYSTH